MSKKQLQTEDCCKIVKRATPYAGWTKAVEKALDECPILSIL